MTIKRILTYNLSLAVNIVTILYSHIHYSQTRCSLACSIAIFPCNIVLNQTEKKGYLYVYPYSTPICMAENASYSHHSNILKRVCIQLKEKGFFKEI